MPAGKNEIYLLRSQLYKTIVLGPQINSGDEQYVDCIIFLPFYLPFVTVQVYIYCKYTIIGKKGLILSLLFLPEFYLITFWYSNHLLGVAEKEGADLHRRGLEAGSIFTQKKIRFLGGGIHEKPISKGGCLKRGAWAVCRFNEGGAWQERGGGVFEAGCF